MFAVEKTMYTLNRIFLRRRIAQTEVTVPGFPAIRYPIPEAERVKECPQRFRKMDLQFCILLGFLLLLTDTPCIGQLGTWNIVNAKVKIDDRWSFFVETQLRSLSFYNRMNYYEIKGMAGYSFSPQFQTGLGLGSYNTFQSDGNFKKPMLNREFRTWVQAVLRQEAGRLNIEHRYRAEQRFTSNGYRNRFRYRLNVACPINNREIAIGTVYAIVWNEIFLNNRAPVFERNRFFTGAGYEMSPTTAIQAGFLSQYDYSPSGSTVLKYLQLSLLLSFNAQKEKRWFRQGVPD